MKDKYFTSRTYLMGAAILGLLTALLRGLSLALAFDGSYFTSGALPTLYRIVALLSLAALALFPLLALKGRISPTRTEITRAGQGGAALAAIFSFACFVSACTISNTSLPAILWLVGLFSLLFATVYFMLQAAAVKASSSIYALLGCAAIFALACLVAFTYFDVATPMNAPHKLDLHAALLGTILYLLYELRAQAGIAKPLAMVSFNGIALFLTLSVSVSDLVGTMVGASRGSLYLVQDLLLLALAVYIGARGFADAALQNTIGKDKTV
ncbi:MAG: hypothetical protein IKC75_06495 [Clostridia bacterium]|nr:hypothetical protein [Clostridia bacterium]